MSIELRPWAAADWGCFLGTGGSACCLGLLAGAGPTATDAAAAGEGAVGPVLLRTLMPGGILGIIFCGAATAAASLSSSTRPLKRGGGRVIIVYSSL